MPTLTADSPSAVADYRRQARRIRANFRGNSFLTYQALRDLADRSDAVSEARSTPVLDSRAALQQQIQAVVERGYTEHARSRLQTFGFTFSERAALLDAAERLGIPRFHANLILAMQENQMPRRQATVIAPRKKSVRRVIALILGAEAAAVAGLMWLFLH